MLRDIDDSSQDRYYIMIEQVMFSDTPDFTQALFLLLAVHYVFNLEYDASVQEPLLFLQEFVAGIKDASIKHSAFFLLLPRAYHASCIDYVTCNTYILQVILSSVMIFVIA